MVAVWRKFCFQKRKSFFNKNIAKSESLSNKNTYSENANHDAWDVSAQLDGELRQHPKNYDDQINSIFSSTIF